MDENKIDLLNDKVPFPEEKIAFARWLFAQSFSFIKGATRPEDFPDLDLPEVAFVGRSNVGKSSLINLLTHRKSLARTSNTPGRTREINFFMGGKSIVLVDLPGYGYAKVTRQESRKWSSLIPFYLQKRQALQRLYLLIDSRHGLMRIDQDVMDLLDSWAISYQVILTKCDKVTVAERAQKVLETLHLIKKRPAAHPEVLLTSFTKKEGIERLSQEIASFVSCSTP